MKIREVIQALDAIAPPAYQESYDNAGLLTGDPGWECTGILCTLDTVEQTIQEAVEKGCNLVVAHHPVIFSGIKKLNGRNYVERTVIAAVKHDIAIFAIHTNLDNVYTGVNKKIADKLGLINQQILAPKNNVLSQLITFAPPAEAEHIRQALFAAGAGNIGNYSNCAFSASGTGTFTPGNGAKPALGQVGHNETVQEERIEVVFPGYLQAALVDALKKAHSYEEVAYYIVPLSNYYQNIGSGIIGDLPEQASESGFLATIKKTFGTPTVRHTKLLGQKVSRVAVCGGSGSFLIRNAIKAQADFYITADIKYHEFFDADGQIVVADIGHWESEQYTIDLLFDILVTKFTTFAVLKSAFCTNPVFYYS